MAEAIFKYFPGLSEFQKDQFISLKPIYTEWNEKINLISRKDFDHFYTRHVLHSLSIALRFNLENGSSVLDFGTGGGFPGIPLSIIFPNCNFLLVDSIQKKIKVVQDVIEKINLKNAEAQCIRVEDLNQKFDYITGRAVKEIPKILKWTKPLLKENSKKKNTGIIYLKGGDFNDELLKVAMKSKQIPLKDLLDDPFFESKKIVHFYL